MFYQRFLILIFLPTVFLAHIESDPQTQITNDNHWIPKLKKTDLNGYSLLTRIPITKLYKFGFYRDVSVLFYYIPEDVEEAQIHFKAHEEKMNLVGGACKPEDIDIHLKPFAFPVVSPQNISFPEDFINDAIRYETISLHMLSDKSNNTITLKNPLSGHWFGLAFVSWTDPQSDKIEQQGIVAVCDTILYTDMRVKLAKFSTIDCENKIDLIYNCSSSYFKYLYKCYLQNEDFEINLPFSIKSVSNDCSDTQSWGVVRINGRSLPSPEQNLETCYFNITKENVDKFISFRPYAKEFHYIEFEYGSDQKMKNDISNMKPCEEKPAAAMEKKMEVIDLVRDTKSQHFTFEYNLSPDVNEDTPTLLNLTSNTITSLKFDVQPLVDIGGTLSISVTLKLDFKYYMGYRRDKFNGTDYTFTENDRYFKLVICLSNSKRHIPLANDSCDVDGKIIPATIILNNTDTDSISNQLHMPYPESGSWYLNIGLFCDGDSVCPCPTITEKNITKYLVNPDGKSAFNSNIIEGTKSCDASVIFSVASFPCFGGKCGRNGNCNFYMSGGFIYSCCSCRGGFQGWDCSDTSNVNSKGEVIMATLFLTLSNLLFIPSVYVAIKRKYYTEAVVYFSTMFFSTFYHACDVSDPTFSFCIVRMGVLQYCDFFCGLLSFWVTLIAMAALNNKLTSVLHVSGAVIIAFGTELDKQALLVFLIPVMIGVCIVSIAWGLRCRRTKHVFPARGYLVVYLPCGLALAGLGLISFAFLQTNANYHIVHSVWHMVIALSILCLLPNRLTFFPKS